ncbi:MAG: nucleotidyltransferase domain-containing protein [Prevotellaceae bacterium]|jgi:predicted nucleotidyltransferase|nr:nucleotidyltransferase domain-containing protein [Prevotellaceae bacterium]
MDKRDAMMLAQQYINVVSEKYMLVHALVFGSYANGIPHADSDIDIAVVIKNIDNLFDIQVDLMQLREDRDLIIEPHVFREKDFNNDDPLVHEILQVGVDLNV